MPVSVRSRRLLLIAAAVAGGGVVATVLLSGPAEWDCGPTSG